MHSFPDTGFGKTGFPASPGMRESLIPERSGDGPMAAAWKGVAGWGVGPPWQLPVSSVIIGKSGAEAVTCHLFFECNQLFFHGPFGVTMNDGSG